MEYFSIIAVLIILGIVSIMISGAFVDAWRKRNAKRIDDTLRQVEIFKHSLEWHAEATQDMRDRFYCLTEHLGLEISEPKELPPKYVVKKRYGDGAQSTYAKVTEDIRRGRE